MIPTRLTLLIFCGLLACKGVAQQPNILWLTCEDMSLYLGSYGHPLVTTPNLDSLASNGIRFTRAYSNGVQCSPARSTLISGVYAPNLATDWHRQSRAVPDSFYFPIYLRRLGYYCTNNSKRDYNANNIPTNVWDESSNQATWANAPSAQPFFAVFNSGITHMNRVATRTTDSRTPRVIQPYQVTPPPMLPNTGAIRDDYAWHLDAVADMDRWVGERLADLAAAGKADSTIIFFFSDHGGCLPGSKAYVSERGGHVPMLAYFPPAFAHLAPVSQPAVIDSFIQFIDLGASMIHLAGGTKPSYMEGRPVMGHDRQPFRDQVFLFRANQGNNFIPSRAIIKGDYQLVWNFNTAYPQGARQSYQWQMPAFQSWEEACLNQQCDSIQAAFWDPMPTFELYHLQDDQHALHNLAYLPHYAGLRDSLRQILLAQLKLGPDLGFYPREMRQRAQQTPFYDLIRQQQIDAIAVIEAAVFASEAQKEDLAYLESLLGDPQAAVRYWGAMGLNQLARLGKIDTLSTDVYNRWQNPSEETAVRIILAEALVRTGQDCEPLSYMLDRVAENQSTANMALQNLGPSIRRLESRIIELHENGQNVSRFMLRGALINAGTIPYQALYDPDMAPSVIQEDTSCQAGLISTIDKPTGTGYRIYPNPAKKQIYIHTVDDLRAQDIQLLDPQGKPVAFSGYAMSPHTFSLYWPMDSPDGLYVLRINGNAHKLWKVP